MSSKIVVVGSANTDFIVHVTQLPSVGETVLGDQFQTARGGKGANQAVAAARLGGEVTLVARLGDDSFGHAALRAYQQEGIRTAYLNLDQHAPSGVALILVNQFGENMIAVASGANNWLSPQDVLAAESAIKEADCLLLQLEIPIETVQTAAEIAHRHHVRVILNPAPATPLPIELYQSVDILTPNETEAAMLVAAENHSEIQDLPSRLAALTGVPILILTLGARGAQIYTQGQSMIVPALPVVPVDTTAAGDAFNGALAVALAMGKGLAQAVQYANVAGAITATRAGAQPSLPSEQELELFVASVAGGKQAPLALQEIGH
jgi:ribokinase